jgi:mRNA-degrading endonuclease RelE of RelBE toxin-antitoxin system
MADYSVSFACSAREELEQFPDDVADRILAKVGALAENPRPVGVSVIRHRRDVYRDL